jgi:competence protein ComEC
MKHSLFLLILFLIMPFRFFQAQQDFEKQQALFPQPQKGIFRVYLSEEPEVLFDHPVGGHDSGRWNGTYQSQVREVRAVCTLLSLDGKSEPPVRVRCSFELPAYPPTVVMSYGETYDLDGKIELPSPPVNPGQFDYRQFLKNRGVAYEMVVAPGSWVKAPAQPPRGFFLLRWAYFLKRAAEDRLDLLLPYPENALLSGILLGERFSIPQDMVETFIVTGTVHILAVSGLITAFVAGILFLSFRVLQFPRKAAAFLTLIGLGFFTLVTGAHPPVCRAALFSALVLLALIFERRVQSGTLLLMTGIILVLINPFVLTDLSFQISFLATAGLMVMASRFIDWFSFLGRPLAVIAATTLAAQLSVWCLILNDFNLLAVYSIPANLVIVPLVLFSTAGGLAALAGSWVSPFLGKLLAAGVLLPLRFLIFLAGWIAQWPWAQVIVGSLPVFWLILFHALLLAAFWAYWPRMIPEKPSERWKIKNRFLRRAQKIIRTVCILFLAFSAVGWICSAFQPQPFRITYLAVGHGNAVVLRSPAGKVFVIDGGKETSGPDRYLPLVAYLRYLGVQKVEGLIDTHPDEDHVGGLVNLICAYPVQTAYEGIGAKSSSRIYAAFHEAIRLKKVPLVLLKRGDEVTGMEPVQIKILHPPLLFQPANADNNRSVVSWAVMPSGAGTFSAVFPGDLERDGLLELLKNEKPFPKIDWLMAPHHGRASGEPALCAKEIKPRFVIFSDGVDYPESRELYEKFDPGVTVLSTALEGAIEVEIGPDGKKRYRCYREEEWHYF